MYYTNNNNNTNFGTENMHLLIRKYAQSMDEATPLDMIVQGHDRLKKPGRGT